MKTLLLSLLVASFPCIVHAQGTVNFASFNSGDGLNAPLYRWDGVTKVYGPDWTAELLAGPTLHTMSLFAQTTMLSGAGAGYFNGGVVTIVGLEAGAKAWVLVRAYPTQYGSYEAAKALNMLDTTYESVPLQVVTGGGQASPGSLLGLSWYPRAYDCPFEHPTFACERSQTTNTVVFTWDIRYWPYSLQQNPDLNPAHWVTVTNDPEVVSANLRTTLSAPRGRMFYRLVHNTTLPESCR